MEKPLAAVRTPENFTFLPQLDVRLTPLPRVTAPEKLKPPLLTEVAL